MVVGRRRRYDINLIVLQQQLIGFVHAAGGFPIGIMQGIVMQIHDRSLGIVLLIVNPSDNRNEGMQRNLVGESVCTVKINGVGIVGMKHIIGVHHGVFVAKEPVNALAIGLVQAFKTVGGAVFIGLDEAFGDHQLLHVVLSRVLKFLPSHHATHRVTHLESGVHQDAIHAS